MGKAYCQRLGGPVGAMSDILGCARVSACDQDDRWPDQTVMSLAKLERRIENVNHVILGIPFD